MDKKKAPAREQSETVVTVNLSESRCDYNRILTPLKAMRAYCLDCCCGSSNEVRLCPSTKCSLFPYRFGKRPRKQTPVDPIWIAQNARNHA